MKKRILHIIPTFDRGGAEKQMSLLACHLPRQEFDVHVCALTRGGPLQSRLREAGIPSTVIGKRWKIDPQAYWQLKRHIAQLQPDLVHTWLFAADAYGRVASKAAGVKCMVTGLRCVDTWKGRVELTVDKYLTRHTARFVANSPGVREFYLRKGFPEDKIDVIPNGILPLEPSRLTRRQILTELELPDNVHLVGLIGRLWPQKRVKDAIWAADLLKVIRDDVHLLIIGDGPQHDRLWKYRDQVEIRDKVHFLGQRSDVAQWIPHFTALWSTSEFEGQSNVIMEAMAAGIPVIATDIPGTRDLVIPEKTGYLVPVGDRAGVARYTEKILNDTSLATQLGEAGRKRMREEFSTETMIERYAALYRELIDSLQR